MKKIYQYPETEIVLVGMSKLIMAGDQGTGSGVIGKDDTLTNENQIFEENDSPAGKSSLWD